ncbi:hypothetical protein GCM10027098_17470 [Bowmanella dokdonensis]
MNNDRQNKALRPAIRLKADPGEPAQRDSELSKAIRLASPPRELDVDPGSGEAAELPTEKSISFRPRLLFWLLLVLVILGCAQFAVGITRSIELDDWLAVGWYLLLGAAGLAAAVFLGREWRALRQLDIRQSQQDKAKWLAQSPAIGEARGYCLQLADKLPLDSRQALVRWEDAMQEHHSDREVMHLFEQQVLQEADEKALRHISQEASASAVMIAISPFVLLDMLLVFWRNLRMVNRICACYGVRPGYWAKVRLLQRMCHSMLYAGASELAADASAWALGGSLTAKISSRAAQGLGAGVLTARFGLQAMQVCRPVPFISVKRPHLGQIAADLVKRLKKLDTPEAAQKTT